MKIAGGTHGSGYGRITTHNIRSPRARLTRWLLHVVLVLGIGSAGTVVWACPTESPDNLSASSDVKKAREPGLCDPGFPQPSSTEAANKNPVLLFNGEMVMGQSDLGHIAGGSTHTRIFNNRLTANYDGPYGFNWTIGEMPYLVSLDSGNTVVVGGSPTAEIRFSLSGGTYSVNNSRPDTYELTAGTNILTLTEKVGQGVIITEFHDFGQGDKAGHFKRRIDKYGIVTEVTSYTVSRPMEVQRSVTNGGVTTIYSILYDYYSSGANQYKLQYAKLRKTTDGTTWTDIRRAEYAYYGASESYGSLNDLKTVCQQTPDGSGGWTTTGKTYYRYYKSGDTNGTDHQLKYAVGHEAFRRIDTAVGDPLTASNGDIGTYADHYFEYDGNGKVTKEIANAGGGCCGGGGSGTSGDTFTRTTNGSYPGTPTDRYNTWKYKTTYTLPDGNVKLVYTNDLGQTMLTVFQETGTSPLRKWYSFTAYNSNGDPILRANSSAITGYDDTKDDLLDKVSGNYTYLSDSDGLIHVTDYYTSTDGGLNDTTTSGGVAGRVQYEKIKHGETGTEIKLRKYEYFKHTGGGNTVYPTAKSIVYPSESNQSLTIETSYAYTWFSSSTQVESETTTYPLVSTAQNGPNSSATSTSFHDSYGHLVYSKDERGFITKYVYDVVRGLMTQRIDDVDTSVTSDEPSGWTTPSGGGKHLVTDYTYDDEGRMTQALGPSFTADLSGTATTVRSASWTVYKENAWDTDDQTWSASGYATGSSPSYTYVLVNPVSISKTDKAGRSIESIVSKRSSGSGKLSSSDTFSQTDWQRWSTTQYDSFGRVTSSRRYHTIPSSGSGSSGAPGTGNYDQTEYTYDTTMNRRVKVKAPGGTITRTVYDALGRTASTWVGTDDTSATLTNPANGGGSNNMVKVVEYAYDGGAAGGDSNLTSVTSYEDGSTTRVTSYTYDWRNRRTETDGEVDYFAKAYYDNLDRVIKSERYNTTSGGNLLARSETSYDDRGRVYQTVSYAVDPSNGAVGNSLTGNTWYDAAGNVIKSISPGSGKVFSKRVYDSLGRTTTNYVGYDTSETSYADASTVTGDTIFSQSETTYDNAGHVTLVTSRQRLNDATGTGELTTTSGANPKARVSYSAAWYDGAGRTIASASYGTNADASLTRPDTTPSSSDTCLVSLVYYDDAGQVYRTIDPMGRESRSVFDHLGRATKSIENYDDGDPTTGSADKDRVTEYAFNSDGQVVTLKARQASSGNDQTTTYIYGSTLSESGIASNSILRSVIYPDSDDVASPLGNGTDTIYDRVELTYNRLGEVLTRKDQNGTIHAYDRDKLGRLTHDRVTTVGSGVDTAILRISRTYDARGMGEKVTSYDNATVGSGSVVNEVQFAYNTFGQLTHDYQAHGGAVNTGSSPKVQYAYATGGSGSNQIRPTTMTYANGKVLTYDYGTANGINDTLSRVGGIIDDDGGSTHLVDYTYLGLGTAVVRNHPEPGVKLDYWGGTTGTFNGLDRFGRVTDHRWIKSGSPDTDVDRIKHGYDRNSNRLYRENTVATANSTKFDELYSYDGLDRLTTADRGTLDGGKTGLSGGTRMFKQNWTLDALGNWSTFQEDANGDNDYADAGDLNQPRTHNKVNELTAFSQDSGQVAWASPAYDRSGNMTTIPKAVSPANMLTAKYDAWNRLVELTDTTSTFLVAKYEYDGLERRTLKKTYNAPTNSNLVETRHYYYSAAWQVLEERVSTNAYADRIYVWGLRYVDELVCRDRDADLDGSHTLEERLYTLQDANFNVTSVVDTSGAIQERFNYTSYGVRSILTPAFTSRGSSGYDWNAGHQGLLIDTESEMLYNRSRLYVPHLGRFNKRDVLQYVDGFNVYQLMRGRVVNAVDPFGTASTVEYSRLVTPKEYDAPCDCSLGWKHPDSRAIRTIRETWPAESWEVTRFMWTGVPTLRDIGGGTASMTANTGLSSGVPGTGTPLLGASAYGDGPGVELTVHRLEIYQKFDYWVKWKHKIVTTREQCNCEKYQTAMGPENFDCRWIKLDEKEEFGFSDDPQAYYGEAVSERYTEVRINANGNIYYRHKTDSSNSVIEAPVTAPDRGKNLDEYVPAEIRPGKEKFEKDRGDRIKKGEYERSN